MKHALKDLDIIGYSDRLPKTLLPSIVPPVFQIRGTKVTVVPPYKGDGDYVVGGTELHISETQSFDENGKITLFNNFIIEAKALHELWIDEIFNFHYDEFGLLASVMDDVISQLSRKEE